MYVHEATEDAKVEYKNKHRIHTLSYTQREREAAYTLYVTYTAVLGFCFARSLFLLSAARVLPHLHTMENIIACGWQ